jgi:intein/homing endonuclease
MVRVVTRSGREVTTTMAHSHLSRTRQGKIVPKVASKLVLGDRIPVSKKMNSKVLFDHFNLKMNNNCDTTRFELDYDNGWIFGAYLSEGNISSNSQLAFTNVSEHFEKRIRKFAKRYEGTYRQTEKKQKINKDYPEYLSRSHHISGIPHIVKFILDECNTGSANKTIPSFAYFASDKFISGLLRGYFDGDGNVNAERQLIRVHSISRDLLEQISLLLTRFGIFGTFGVEKQNRVNPVHYFVIQRKYAKVFFNKIGSDFNEKKSAMKEIVEYMERDDIYSKGETIDRIPEVGELIAKTAKPLNLEGYSRNYARWERSGKPIGRETLRTYVERFEKQAKKLDIDISESLNLLKQTVNSEVVWDEIIRIDILEDPKELVYDFGVDGNHTFMIQNGIMVHNTLNSIDWEDKIIVIENAETTIAPIGEYIDNYIREYPELTKRLEDNPGEEMGDTYYVDTSSKDIKTISVSKEGKISWNRVTALTKHLPMNKDGTDDLVKIRTRLGREVTATKAKSFLTRVDNEIVPIRGDEIRIGTVIPVINSKIENLPLEIIKIINESSKLDKDVFNDVILDKIVNIEIVKPTNKYVYDMTVEKNKTFIGASGICLYDTFHHAGIGGMGATTLGVPRMNELMSFSKDMKTPVMTVYLEGKYKEDSSMANKIASYIKYTTIKDVQNRVDIYYDPTPYAKGGFMESDNVYNIFHSYNPSKYSCQSEINDLPWLVRLELNKEKMMEKNITLLDLKAKFCNHWENRYREAKGIKKEERVILERITQCSILSNNDNDKVPIVHIRFDMTEFNFNIMTGFLDTFIDNFKLKGIESIKKIINVNNDRVISFDNDNKELENKKQYVIYTDGINMVNIRYVNGIDLNKTTCNDVRLIYEKFGIEAARASLIKEVKNVFESAGNRINFQHRSILADIMTNTGTLVSADRNGLNKLDIDPLSKASFEKTVDQLLTAAVFGEVDSMNSVSARIMAGLAIKGGTGLCNVVLDTEVLEKSEYIEDIEHKYKKTFNELSTDAVVEDVIGKATEGIFIPV